MLSSDDCDADIDEDGGTVRARLTLWLPRLLPLLIFVAVFLLHAGNIPGQGLTDDDDFYAPAGIRYAQWLGQAVTSPTTAFSQEAIDAAFTQNHEHPPFAKFVFGVFHAVFHQALGVTSSLDGARLGNAFFAALLCAGLFVWLRPRLGAGVAAAAVVVLLSLPRFFFHSEVATLDVPVAAMIVVVAACFSWANETDSLRRALVCGFVFGLACLTKLNAPFAVLPCVLVVLLERWRGFRVERPTTTSATTPSTSTTSTTMLPSLVLPPIPPALLAMALMAPLLFVALWPWLWNDTAARLGGYLAFHLKHYPIFLFAGGEIWNEPFAPGSVAVIMAVITIPVVVVVTGVIGAVSAAAAVVRLARANGRDSEDGAAGGRRRDRVLALVLLQAAFSLGIVAVSNVPRYGGEKLFMPFFPFWCVLAAVGCGVVSDACVALAPRFARARIVFVVVVVIAVAPGVKGSVDFGGGYALSYYGEAIGGLRGAVSRGYERTYYDVADKDLARWLDLNARGMKVHVEPNHKEYVRTYRWLRKDGVIDRNAFALVDRERDADLVVLTHERRWSTYPALRDRLRPRTPIHELRKDGVPLYTVYAR